ncbi:hypothetical protein [Haloparvum alkalitolerans]|uniref:hypothetical protein n=1 Tax=Haloparvum alkalitolerans TaxID=1042953 RepID=UPI003CEA7792
MPDRHLTRRKFGALLGFVVPSISGCLSNVPGSNPTPTPEPTEEGDYPNNVLLDDRVMHRNETITIPAGEYEPYRVDASGGAHWLLYDFIVKSGGPIDVFLFDEDAYSGYTQGENVEFYSVYSHVEAASEETEFPLEDAERVLVFDNTPWRTEPQGEVTVELEIELATSEES